MARRSSIRASDDDRERVAERLREATVEGRLLAEELEERLARLLRARTYGELDALVADLPRTRGPVPANRPRVSAARITTHAVGLVVVGALALAVVAAVLAVFVVIALAFLWAALMWRLVLGRRLPYHRWVYANRRMAHRYAARFGGAGGRRRAYGPFRI